MIDNTPLAGGSHLLRVVCEDARRDLPRSHPGQFVQMLAAPSIHLLRRPMSIHDEGDGWRSVLVKPVGPASRELAGLRGGDALDTSPPLGRGFAPAAELAAAPLLLVGGGFGIAPLHFLARRLDALPVRPDYRVVYGGRTGRDVESELLRDVAGPVWLATEDGSLGHRGTCVDLAVALLARTAPTAAQSLVLACGPHGMMLALHEALYGRVARIDVSLEEIMACGVGVCMGCVTPSVRGYVPICTEGPVFHSDEVFGLQAEVRHV